MVRTPCCERMGMKKGPWTPEEDQILISYVRKYGHGNWRALPKQAGLTRCGKSCRLRWINYLRPDIKRGNFTTEEEETIIKLHQVLGNRWSAIAATLPGRTDNEIKNYWHGHLKKKLKQYATSSTNRKEMNEETTVLYHHGDQISRLTPSISSQNCLESACLTATRKQQPEELALTSEQEGANLELTGEVDQFPIFSYFSMVGTMKNHGSNIDANRDFWYNLFVENSNESHGSSGQFG